MTIRTHLLCAWTICLLAFSSSIGCTKKDEFVRDPVNKVTGTLLIDGNPEPMVAVRLVRIEGADEGAGTSKALGPSAFTDGEGNFSIGTYDKGPDADGAPDGEYAMTFQWGQMNLMGGLYTGDKLNGKYADSKKSEYKVTVAGEPVDLGVIELSTK
jgi:hypothetical protein